MTRTGGGGGAGDVTGGRGSAVQCSGVPGGGLPQPPPPHNETVEGTPSGCRVCAGEEGPARSLCGGDMTMGP